MTAKTRGQRLYEHKHPPFTAVVQRGPAVCHLGRHHLDEERGPYPLVGYLRTLQGVVGGRSRGPLPVLRGSRMTTVKESPEYARVQGFYVSMVECLVMELEEDFS